MNHLKIGVRLESLGLPLRPALQEAERLGVGGVQLDAAGELGPDQLSQTGRRELRHLLHAHSLDLTAVGCPLRYGLDVAEDQQPRIEHVQKVMALSFDLGPRLVIIQAGRIPADETSPAYQRLTEALRALGQHGDRAGTRLALETGLEPGGVLAPFLARFDSGSLAVNFDPANLFMNGFDPYESARALGGRIAHAHAKDARRSSASRSAQEVPLGQGDIDWLRLADVFEEIEYSGWLVVERESGVQGLADVAAGVAFLRRLVH